KQGLACKPDRQPERTLGKWHRYLFLARDQPWLVAPLEPHDSEQIDNAWPEPLVHAVLGASRQAGPMIYGNRDDPCACAPVQRRQEPMHVIEVRQLDIGLTIEELDATTRVGRSIPQQPGTHSVGDTRLQPAEPGVAPHYTVAHKKAHIRVHRFVARG